MPEKLERARQLARIALGLIRLVNGAVALFAPAVLVRRMGVDPDANPAAFYALRLFGVRTVLIAAELLLPNAEVQARALRVAPLIHASDVGAALMTFTRPQLPRSAAWTLTAISTVNLVLAFVAQPSRGANGRRR